MAQIEEMPHTQLPKLIYLRLGHLCVLHMVSPTKSQLTFSVANIIAVRISPSHGYITASRPAVMSLCHDITCESILGSPFRFYFSLEREESLGTRLIKLWRMLLQQFELSFGRKKNWLFGVRSLLQDCKCARGRIPREEVPSETYH